MTDYTVAPFPRFDENTAPEASKEHLLAAKAAFGLIPNVEAVMAQAPTLLGTYMAGWDQFGQTSFSAAEQQIVYMTNNFENNCDYCSAWHTILAEQSDLSTDDVETLRQGGRLSDPKLEALRVFTQSLVRTRGNLAPADLKAFFAAGYTEQQALEVVLGSAVKLMSNYTNAISQTPLDEAAQAKAWVKPTLRAIA